MGKYFADVHASHESQLQNLPHGLADTDEILACRAKPQTYENILELADALCWQLRFREAIDALTQGSQAGAGTHGSLPQARPQVSRYAAI